jgi:hypothetical protein
MGPFMQALGSQLPPGQPVYAMHVDETLEAEVPFYTGRALISLDPKALDRRRPGTTPSPPMGIAFPAWVLVQNGGEPSNILPPGYVRVMHRSFGRGRSLALWHAPAMAPR